MIGQLWCSLADYYIRAGHFEKVYYIFQNISFSVIFVVR